MPHDEMSLTSPEHQELVGARKSIEHMLGRDKSTQVLPSREPEKSRFLQLTASPNAHRCFVVVERIGRTNDVHPMRNDQPNKHRFRLEHQSYDASAKSKLQYHLHELKVGGGVLLLIITDHN